MAADLQLPLVPVQGSNTSTRRPSIFRENEKNIINLTDGTKQVSAEETLKAKGYVLGKLLGEGNYAKVGTAYFKT